MILGYQPGELPLASFVFVSRLIEMTTQTGPLSPITPDIYGLIAVAVYTAGIFLLLKPV